MTEPVTQPAASTRLKSLQQWFYAKETPYALALIRITFPLALLVAMVPRWLHVRELYSTDGSPTPFWWSYGYSNVLPIFSPEVAMALYTAMVFSLLAVVFGWKTRLSLLVVATLVPYFGVLDSLGTLTKYTVISTHIALLLGLSGCGSVWSIDAMLEKRRSTDWSAPKFEVWPQRLIQILIGFVYLGSAATKIHTNGFFTGDQMYYWALTNTNFANPLGEWMTAYPSLLVISGFIAAAWEVLFIFLVWKNPGRYIVLGLGILFHLATYFLLGLLVFPLLFFSLYCCFLTENEARKVGLLFDSLVPWSSDSKGSVTGPLRLASWPAFACLMAVSSVAAVAAERRLDVYDERGANGPTVLQPMSQAAVEELLKNDTKVAIPDQLYSIDVGRHLLSGYIAQQQTKFAVGETVQMQARLVFPHHDLWVEYVLRDAGNMIIAREGMLAPRSDNLSTFRIPLGKQLQPGIYEIQVSLNGSVAGSRKITVE